MILFEDVLERIYIIFKSFVLFQHITTYDQKMLQPPQILKEMQKPTSTSFQEDAVHALVKWHAIPLRRIINDHRHSAKIVSAAFNTFFEWCNKEDCQIRLRRTKIWSFAFKDLESASSTLALGDLLDVADHALPRLFQSEVFGTVCNVYEEIETKFKGEWFGRVVKTFSTQSTDCFLFAVLFCGLKGIEKDVRKTLKFVGRTKKYIMIKCIEIESSQIV